jgi:predicted metal-dependent hydrolase
MKLQSRYLVISVVLIAIATAYGQQRENAELRVTRLQQAMEQLTKGPRSIEQVPQDKLMQQIVDEVLYLHRENAALRKEVEQLKARK